MKITWLGHACFRIEKDDYVIVMDPYGDGVVPGLGEVRETADLVLCSHGHRDHSAVDCVTLREGGVNPLKITLLDTYHDEVQGAKRGPNKITILDDGKVRIAHMGDIGCDLTESQIAKLKGIDVVLIPVGGHYTINGVEAAKMVAEMEPKHVIPMHYQDQEAGFGYDIISSVTVFTNEMSQVAVLHGSEIDTDKEYVEQVLVLTPALVKK